MTITDQRLQELLDLGGRYDGESVVFDYFEEEIARSSLYIMTSEDFDNLLEELKTEYAYYLEKL